MREAEQVADWILILFRWLIAMSDRAAGPGESRGRRGLCGSRAMGCRTTGLATMETRVVRPKPAATPPHRLDDVLSWARMDQHAARNRARHGITGTRLVITIARLGSSQRRGGFHP